MISTELQNAVLHRRTVGFYSLSLTLNQKESVVDLHTEEQQIQYTIILKTKKKQNNNCFKTDLKNISHEPVIVVTDNKTHSVAGLTLHTH